MAAEILQPFVCGGLSTMFASSCIHPIDLAKVRLQLIGQGVANSTRPSAFTILREMIRAEGVKSIYAGLSAALLRQATYGTARIGLHQSFSNYLIKHNDGKNIPFYQKTASGMASGAIAVVIGTPFDVALVRMQADSLSPPDKRRGYKNVFDALLRVFKEEGVGRLWRGLTPNILRVMFNNAGMLATYDQSIEVLSKHVFHDVGSPSINTQLGASLISGLACTIAALPFDMLKSRLQDMKPDANGVFPYKGVADCSWNLLKNEGIFAFWRGFGAYYARTSPHAMIILMTREQFAKGYRQVFGLDKNKEKEKLKPSST